MTSIQIGKVQTLEGGLESALKERERDYGRRSEDTVLVDRSPRIEGGVDAYRNARDAVCAAHNRAARRHDWKMG